MLGEGLSGPREGCGAVGVCVHSFRGRGRERAVGTWWDQGGLWGGLGLCAFLHKAWAREGSGRLVGSGRALGEGLSGPREGCGGFRIDSNCLELVGEGSKGPRGGLRLGA